jgi:hypothetical protein
MIKVKLGPKMQVREYINSKLWIRFYSYFVYKLFLYHIYKFYIMNDVFVK